VRVEPRRIPLGRVRGHRGRTGRDHGRGVGRRGRVLGRAQSSDPRGPAASRHRAPRGAGACVQGSSRAQAGGDRRCDAGRSAARRARPSHGGRGARGRGRAVPSCALLRSARDRRGRYGARADHRGRADRRARAPVDRTRVGRKRAGAVAGGTRSRRPDRRGRRHDAGPAAARPARSHPGEGADE
jgi:hypothetical protein